MENKINNGIWWLKNHKTPSDLANSETPKNILKHNSDVSSSLAEFLEKEREIQESLIGEHTDTDIESIIDEINRLAAQSPLGPYEKDSGERSIEEIMREAERLYQESSKSFEQLSSRSKTSVNLTDMLNSPDSKLSTPTPKSASPLPFDPDVGGEENDILSSYSDDFTDDNKTELNSPSPNIEQKVLIEENRPTETASEQIEEVVTSNLEMLTTNDDKPRLAETVDSKIFNPPVQCEVADENIQAELLKCKEEIVSKTEMISTLEKENHSLRDNIAVVKNQLRETNALLEQTKIALSSHALRSPELNVELERAVEEVKDTKEFNTALQLQLDGLNKTHQLLKGSYEELLNSNKIQERRVVEIDSALTKYKSELLNVQQHRDKLLANEVNLTKFLESEKLLTKNLKLQNEKDARCIQDLNRQIKEMERIISRKHPDSVSALIVAAKNDSTETNITARKLLEDRIKMLENEASNRDVQSSRIFLEVQEKFNLMKNKYESHIEDLELHVSDLKNQLKRRSDCYDVYTQTFLYEQKIPEKETIDTGVQTEKVQPLKIGTVRRPEKPVNTKEETHLLATIRGLQADLANKEKVIMKNQKEFDELRKTNRRLQKEREGSLKNLSDKRDCRSFPDRLALQVRTEMATPSEYTVRSEEELAVLKAERDKMKSQLCRIEEDYQNLKSKRLQDLSALQEVHEHEISTYIHEIAACRNELELQHVTLSSLKDQLLTTKEELAIVTADKNHICKCRDGVTTVEPFNNNMKINDECSETMRLHKKIGFLEQKYDEREQRLRIIVQGLAQKQVTNRSCEQCAARQQQLIGYKVELDQLLANVRSLR